MLNCDLKRGFVYIKLSWLLGSGIVMSVVKGAEQLRSPRSIASTRKAAHFLRPEMMCCSCASICDIKLRSSPSICLHSPLLWDSGLLAKRVRFSKKGGGIGFCGFWLGFIIELAHLKGVLGRRTGRSQCPCPRFRRQ